MRLLRRRSLHGSMVRMFVGIIADNQGRGCKGMGDLEREEKS
jgi:hypothetical protein